MPENRAQSITKQGLTLQRPSGLVLVPNTPKGRGVFASQHIPSGTVIDISPVLIFTPDEVAQHTSQICLDHYTYNYPTHASKTQALALGLGSLFNHSRLRQNVGWKRDVSNACIIYTALRDIAPNEELCINYGGIWFADADDDATSMLETQPNVHISTEDEILPFGRLRSLDGSEESDESPSSSGRTSR